MVSSAVNLHALAGIFLPAYLFVEFFLKLIEVTFKLTELGNRHGRAYVYVIVSAVFTAFIFLLPFVSDDYVEFYRDAWAKLIGFEVVFILGVMLTYFSQRNIINVERDDALVKCFEYSKAIMVFRTIFGVVSMLYLIFEAMDHSGLISL